MLLSTVALYGVLCIKIGTVFFTPTTINIEVNNFIPSRIGIIAVVSLYAVMLSVCAIAVLVMKINAMAITGFFLMSFSLIYYIRIITSTVYSILYYQLFN